MRCGQTEKHISCKANLKCLENTIWSQGHITKHYSSNISFLWLAENASEVLWKHCHQILLIKQCFVTRPKERTLLVIQISNVWPSMFDRLARNLVQKLQGSGVFFIEIQGDISPNVLRRASFPAMFCGVAKRINIACNANLKCLTNNIWSSVRA